MVTFLKYTTKRAKQFQSLMRNMPRNKMNEAIIFSYGDTAFKFKHKGRTIEVSRYDEEIIIRKNVK